MGALTFELPSNAGYYLFAKCSKTGESGTWIMTQTQYKFEPTDDPNNYYFLVGVLSTLYADDNFRDFTTTYGFTRINGNTITTGRIVTSDGECYLDLDGNKFRIGDASSSIDWNVSRDNAITLKNVSVISESGDVSPLGVYRGTWNASYVYYPGDEVSYTENGATCTYRYIHPTPTKGHKPTDSTYWAVVAKGANGVNADSNKLVYCYSFDKPAKPTGTALIPTGWSDTPDRENVKVTHGSVWTLKDGYFISPTIDHSQITTNRITIVTTKPNQMLALEIWAQSETNFDFVLVGKLDTEGLSRVSNYLDRVSGPDAKKVVYIPIPTAGTHFVDVAYAKDQSNSLNGDCGRYRVVTVPNCWLSVGIVSGETAKVVSWSDPVPFSIDTADVERIYCLMSEERTPAIPHSDEYIDDYVPPLSTENHVVGKEYKQGEMVIGADGNYYECTTTTTTTTPVYKSGNFWVRSLQWDLRQGWTDNPQDVSSAYRYQYESVRKKKDGKWGTFSTPVLWMVLPKNGDKGDKGDDGINGDYTEYRYAVNGSKSSAPGLVDTDRSPAGWTTAMPAVGTLKYLWLTTAVINGQSNALKAKWTTPIRVTPYDGVDGKPGKDGKNGDSPVLVFRGNYDSSKTYYGNAQRIDAVKYNNHYYIARIDAGSFSNILPTSTAKWNDFGAEFETIATNLLLAEGANIGDWFIKSGQIVSTLDETLKNRIMLQVGVYDGNTLSYQPKIVLESENSGGSHTMTEDRTLGSIITLDATQGTVETRSKDYYAFSYISPAGIFANRAGQEAMSETSGCTYRAAVVGLGFASVNKQDWQVNINQTMIAGIFGRASNNGTAPAYGGFFQRLYAGGLVLGRKAIVDTTSNTNYLATGDTMVIGYCSDEEIVYLPTDPYEGQVVFVKQWWSGYMRFKPRTGHHIYDDHTENDYYDFAEGQGGMFVFSIGYISIGSSAKKTEAWIVSRWKF